MRATPEGTRRFAERLVEGGTVHPSAYAPDACGRHASSLGLGTYLGDVDDATDARYEAAVLEALTRGVNVLDTAINYRCQRSERAIGRALARAFASGLASRDEIVVGSKVGYLAYDGAPPAHAGAWVHDAYVARGVFAAGEVVGGHHVLGAGYVRYAIDRSLENLGLDALDVEMLHNPETQLDAVPRATLHERLRASIEVLEEACSAGKVGVWGVATWDALRLPPGDPHHLALTEILALAREVAGDAHHFRAVELPFGLALPQALTRATQPLDGRLVTPLAAAARLGLTVWTSAPLHEGRLLTRALPPRFVEALGGLPTDAARALHFTRSTPGVGTTLFGTTSVAHLAENAAPLGVPRADAAAWASLRQALAAR